jgi:hypothetical protein
MIKVINLGIYIMRKFAVDWGQVMFVRTLKCKPRWGGNEEGKDSECIPNVGLITTKNFKMHNGL